MKDYQDCQKEVKLTTEELQVLIELLEHTYKKYGFFERDIVILEKIKKPLRARVNKN